MKVLVVGSGAREHAMVWKLALSNGVSDIYCAPGNGGTALIAQNLDMVISSEAHCDRLAGWAFDNQIDLAVVGPEAPLQFGLADAFISFGIKVAGPTREAARLEWSKSWARDFMRRHGIPGPDYTVISGLEEVRKHLQDPTTHYPLVLKADGLAAGKGAAVVTSPEEGADALATMLEMGALPKDAAGVRVVVEEFLEGAEVSAIAFADGTHVSMMPPACDYKRLLDGDQGVLTGGMGSYTPTQLVTPELWKQVEDSIMLKAVSGMMAEGVPYRGFLYAGLMLTESGPKVLEFNCRMGDPETQVLLPRLKTPFEEICVAVADGTLQQLGEISWSDNAVVGVVVASESYPLPMQAPQRVKGLGDLDEGILVFHSGTQLLGSSSLQPLQTNSNPTTLRALFGKKPQTSVGNLDDLGPNITASGGRLLTVVAMGNSLREAYNRVYLNVRRIGISGMQYRHDIAARELGTEGER